MMFTKDQVAKIVKSLSTGVRKASTEAGMYTAFHEGAKTYYATIDALFSRASSDPAAFLAYYHGDAAQIAHQARASSGAPAGSAGWADAFARAAAEPPEG